MGNRNNICIEREFLIQENTGVEWRNIFNSKDFDLKYYYDGDDLGANYNKEKTVFKVWAPTAKKVVLNLYTTGSDEEEGANKLESINMEFTEKGIWQAEIKGDLHGIYYTYTVNANKEVKETGDIYAKSCGVNGKRSMVVDFERTNPEKWEDDSHVLYKLEETELWEVHICDFSNDPNSGVNPAYRGKYLGFTEENTTLNNDNIHPTCLNYLKNLGITHVHLLPSFDYGSIDESSDDNKFNWGYDPANFNIPEGSYSTDAFKGEVRIYEYKKMVQSLHKAKISVVMDVVYNHTHSLDSHFNNTVPYYYYRQWEDGTFCNGSDCGNDTASDRKMFQKYMIESVLYWIKEYHIDGFRFDLMGLHDTETLNLIREAVDKLDCGKDIIIYGEPWTATNTGFKEGYISAKKDGILHLNDRISVFNDDTRDAIKGIYNEPKNPGFINGGLGFDEKIKRAICGLFDEKLENQPRNPSQVINYISAHDNNTLWDKLVYSVKNNKDYITKYEDLLSMNKLGAAIVQFSKGIPFMQAGEEGARTKLGEGDSYCSSKELNQLDWNRMYEFGELIDYYKGLMKVRKSLKPLCNLSKESLANIYFLEGLPNQVVGYKIKNMNKNDNLNEVVVIFNASNEEIKVKLDTAEWNVMVDEKEANEKVIRKIKEYATIAPISAYVICK